MEKLKSSICFSCCFRRSDVDPLAHEYHPSPTSPWARAKASEIPDVKEKCRSLISRAGRHRRRNSAGNFGYDPLSYALNFDEGPDFDVDGEISPAEYKYRNFSSRLPATPPRSAIPAKELTCS